jgi:AcrR family transcriptional regulator
MPPKPTRPNAIRKNDRRKIEIIEIAMPLFAALGPDGVSLRDVADAAGIKVGTLYYYFPEKQKLYQAAADHALAASSRLMMENIQRHDSPRTQLASIIEAHFEVFSAGNPVGILADRELLTAAASTRGERSLSPGTISEFRETQAAFKRIIADLAGLPKDAPVLDWLEEFATSSIYGVARIHGWYNQTRPEKLLTVAQAKAHLLETLIASFVGMASVA